MSRSLSDLSSRFQPLAFALIARCAEAGVAVLIVNTLRTQTEQDANIANGVSWTQNSKHLPQPPEGKAEAIDLAPFEIYQLHGPDKLQWNAADPVWLKMGEIGEALGLRWGGRWTQKDMGHFEFRDVNHA